MLKHGSKEQKLHQYIWEEKKKILKVLHLITVMCMYVCIYVYILYIHITIYIDRYIPE